ncbi:MAG: hypothetical protein J6Y02_10875 [Pseudobutyrivibrio sp.]|nr:hypothetical protein [Pseudobutyrivibrio sp.]
MGKKFMGYDNASELITAIGNKIKAKYTKPNTGIPKSDLASGVQTSLEKADSALQSETDPTVPTWAKQTSKPSYHSDEISDTNKNHKFATQAQLNQISTNQANIWYNTDMGVRNAAQITNFTYTAGAEGGNYMIPCAPLTGDIVIKCGSITSTDTDSTTSIFLLYFTDGSTSTQQLSRGTNITQNVSIGAKVLRQISCYPSNNYANSKNDTITVSNLIVCSKAIYDQDSSYASGAISNAQLTSSMMAMCDVGAKNLVNHIDLATTLTGNASGITLTPNDDGSITLNGTSSSSSAVIYARCFIKGTVKSNTNYIVLGTDNTNIHVQLLAYDSSGNTTILSNEQGINTVDSGTYARYEARLWIKAKPSSGTQFSNLKIYPMICEESLFKSNPARTPCALPNYDLTRLQSEDRAGLVECVDGGAKNLLSIEGETRTVNGVTATYNSDGSITTSGTASGGNANFTIRTYTPAEAAKLSGLVLSGCPSGGSDATWNLILQKNSSNYDVYARDTGKGAVVGTVPSVSCVLILQIKSGYSKNTTWYPMLCTNAAFDVSQKFVPYRPSWDIIQAAIRRQTFTIEPGTGITIGQYSAYKMNGYAWISLQLKSSTDLSANAAREVCYLPSTTSKQGSSLVVFSASVENSDVNPKPYISAYSNQQPIKIKPTGTIPADTWIYITGTFMTNLPY